MSGGYCSIEEVRVGESVSAGNRVREGECMTVKKKR